MNYNFFCDIVFNLPKSESSSWLKDYGSLIGNTITILLFITAYFINDRIEKKRKKKIFEEKLRYLTSLIISSIKIAENQKAKIETTLEKFKKENQYQFHLLETISFLDIKRVSEKLNLEDYFLAYLSRYGNDSESVNQFRSTIQGFDFLNDFNVDLNNFLERASKNHDDRLFKFNSVSEKIDLEMREVEKWIKDNSADKLEEFNRIVHKYYTSATYETNGEELFKFRSIFLEPMSTFIIRYYSNFTTGAIFLLRQLLETADGELKNIKSGLKIFSNELEGRIAPLKTAIEKIQKGSEKLASDFASQ